MKNAKRKTQNNSAKLKIGSPAGEHRSFAFCLFPFTFRRRGGYAALTAMLLIIFSSLAIIGGLAFFAAQEAGVNRAYARAVAARAAAEAGIEDAAYRIFAGKQMTASETLAVGSDSTTVAVATVGNQRTIRSAGSRANVQQNLETRVNMTTTGASFYYGVQVGDGGITMGNGAQVNGNVYANGSMSGGTVTGDATVAGGITALPQLEWAANNADQFFATASSNRDIAQSFTAPAGGLLSKVSVYLAKVGSPASNITLRITRDSGGKPDRNGELASAAIAPSQVGITASWIGVSLASPPTLTNGTKYWIVLDYGANSATNYWVWRKDTTDGYAGNTGRYANDWKLSSAVWVNVGGDLSFRVWVGGINTAIANATIGGQGHANVFVNVIAGGSACPNANCMVENPPRQEMPISDGVIQDWRDEAAAGGTIAGDYSVTNDVSLGPKEITGNLLLTTNNKILTVTGTLYVRGNISIDNGSTVRCASAYGTQSCVIISNGWIHVKNNGVFSGSGQSGSFIMLLSTLSCDGTSSSPPCDTGHHHGAIDLHNNASGAIFYASNGLLNAHNNVSVTELTAYKINLDQNTTITYESGLADMQFSSGPSGGYAVEYWKQVP